MKFYEVLKELDRCPHGYIVRGLDEDGYSYVLHRDSKDKIREVYIGSAIAGNEGFLYTLLYYNGHRTQELLSTNEFRFLYSYEELFEEFVKKSKKSQYPSAPKTVAERLKKAVRKHLVSKESAEKLLAKYISEVTGVNNEA